MEPCFPSNSLAAKFPDCVLSDEDAALADSLAGERTQTRVYTILVYDKLVEAGRELDPADVSDVVRGQFGPFEGHSRPDVALARVRGKGWFTIPQRLRDDVESDFRDDAFGEGLKDVGA